MRHFEYLDPGPFEIHTLESNDISVCADQISTLCLDIFEIGALVERDLGTLSDVLKDVSELMPIKADMCNLLHGRLLYSVIPEGAGVLRSDNNVMVPGPMSLPLCPFGDVAHRMQQLELMYDNQDFANPNILQDWFCDFVAISPFGFGNECVGNILMSAYFNWITQKKYWRVLLRYGNS